MLVRKMRLLRHKHHIYLTDLSRFCGLSPQRLSEIELNVEGLLPATEEKVRQALYAAAGQREAELSSLRSDLERYGDSLFETVKESDYAL